MPLIEKQVFTTGRMGGAVKANNKALYNAEKVEFFGARMVRAAKRSEAE
jgi:hypothetical protein